MHQKTSQDNRTTNWQKNLAALIDHIRLRSFPDILADFLATQCNFDTILMVTYKKSDELRSLAAMIPADRILVETDSPYLSPYPKRGQRPNEPALVTHTAQCIADVRGVSLEEFGQTTTENARRLFFGS